ncbi:MAG TPA: hypothetical protein VNW51_06960 [Mucilaginibacter sp.]|jgi:hypothetical protein|nr:hypothetical protein [Mucilaginibacter sp.]
MHIAYTALPENKPRPKHGNAADDDQLLIRLKAYYAVCDKYSKEITAIQKRLPGWLPPLPVL